MPEYFDFTLWERKSSSFYFKLRVELIGDEYVLKEWEETLSPTSTLHNMITAKGLGISWESWVQMWDQKDVKSTVQWYKAEHKRFLEEYPNIRRIEIYQNLYDWF